MPLNVNPPLQPVPAVANPGYPKRLARPAVILGVAVTALIALTACPDRRMHRLAGMMSPPEPPAEVLVEAETFHEAIREYNEAARGGWTQEECEAVARRFRDVSDTASRGFPPALFNAGVVMTQCDRPEEAAARFEEANRSAIRAGERGFAPALVRLGALAYEAEEREAARRYFDQAREADRRSADAYVNIAVLQRESGQWSEAQLNLRRALAVNSDHMVAFAQMAQLYLDLSESNEQMLDIAELVCQQATERAAELDLSPADIAPIFNVWGLALIRKGEVVRAVTQFERAVEADPAFFEAHMNLGAVNLSYRGYGAAERAFRAAVQLRPGSYEAHLSLGAALRGLERFDVSQEAYSHARDLDAERPDAHYNIAVLLQDYQLRQAESPEAQIEVLQRALSGYQRFLRLCSVSSQRCVDAQDESQSMVDAAERRIEACETMISALREAEQLANNG